MNDHMARRRMFSLLAPDEAPAGPVQASFAPIDLKAVRRRLRLIRAALDLSPGYVEEVVASLDKGDETELIAFAKRHGQSLEWIVTGDLAPMLRRFAGAASRTHG